jgi:flagellar hook-length control protein FliK
VETQSTSAPTTPPQAGQASAASAAIPVGGKGAQSPEGQPQTQVPTATNSQASGFGASSQPNTSQEQGAGSAGAHSNQNPPGATSSQHAAGPSPTAAAVVVAQTATGPASPTQTALLAANSSPQQSSAVPMQEMIDSIRATIEIAARQGIAQARIALQPQELGHISIRLSQTSEGLLARVSAETPAAAQALADGRSELRQSLNSLGLTLLRLDIGSFGSSEAGSREHLTERQDSSGISSPSTAPEDVETVGELGVGSPPASIARGELVDVLA